MANFKEFNKKLKSEISKDKFGIFWIILFVVYAATTFELFNQPFGNPVNLKIFIDDMIPMIKELIIVYHTFAPMMIVVGVVLFVYDKKNYKKFVITLFLSQTIAYVIYIFFQTYVPRYDVTLLGNDIFSKLVKGTYLVDNPYSGAPSLHVSNMVISIWFYSKLKFSKLNKFIMISYLTLIAATTVLVKQHVFLDIPAGILFAGVMIFCVEKIKKQH